MAHIFISYSHEDLDFARYVRALLEHQGFVVWMDEKRLSAGMDWWDEIQNNIDRCFAFVVIMSPASYQSVFVKNEILRAINQKKTLFPILYQGQHFGMLAHVQFEDMRGGLNDQISGEMMRRLHQLNGNSAQQVVRVEVIQDDILRVPADVLLLKYAYGFHGADLAVIRQLGKAAYLDYDFKVLNDVGAYYLIDAQDNIVADSALFVGTERLRDFGYRQVREFASRALTILGKERPQTQHVAMTIHGVNSHRRLDEGETVLAQLAGLIDVIQAQAAPSQLQTIRIVELNTVRYERIHQTLKTFFDEVDYAQVAKDDPNAYDLTFVREQAVITPQAGSSQVKPYAIVHMPDSVDLDDHFFYGIERPVHAVGLLCERIAIPDQDEQIEENRQLMLERIGQASVFICDVSAPDAIHHLQVGYAWGKGVPTQLITRQAPPPLLGTAIHYDKIWQLEERLGQWLKKNLSP